MEYLRNIEPRIMNLLRLHRAWMYGWMITVEKLVNNDETMPSTALLLLLEASAALRRR